MPASSRPHRHSARNPGSQTALRELNQQRIADTLLASGPSTQAELARQTGLSTATISNIVRIMSDAGIVETEPTTSSGRRALLVRLCNRSAVAVGIDFGRRHLRIAIATLGYDVVAEENIELPVGHRAEEGIETASNLLTKMLADNAIAHSSVLGVGVGIPGPIDRRAGRVVQGAILPEWVGIDLVELEDGLRFPVVFDNDANLGALAEVTWGPHSEIDNLVFVKVGSGIGAGLILNGRPFYGGLGITGEIGHDTITDNGVVCHCGNRGCLETVASTSVMLDLLSRSGVSRVGQIVSRAQAGDSATLRVLDDAGLAIGRALASVANLINPEVVVVGGPLAELGDLFLSSIERGLMRHAVPSVGESTRLVMSSLGERAEALGAAALVLQHQAVRHF
ncbi:ROK family transcriptional regulator [Lacisediminihabitans changchengi]|uniref:ROK family transcriptional regulator n=1 Tax=Lacisediminihabitans changchengi TaxID=2787634 RepID=A0A934SP58_9MICO|nr:ROK family transcriptional regulator [Lacisediminihabitans changchengi]MBK4349123.1 ROK family transcriptional regulator [Lacisediminihabitans changchengi]